MEALRPPLGISEKYSRIFSSEDRFEGKPLVGMTEAKHNQYVSEERYK
jgi:hypothetical protein